MIEFKTNSRRWSGLLAVVVTLHSSISTLSAVVVGGLSSSQNPWAVEDSGPRSCNVRLRGGPDPFFLSLYAAQGLPVSVFFFALCSALHEHMEDQHVSSCSMQYSIWGPKRIGSAFCKYSYLSVLLKAVLMAACWRGVWRTF
jgi:hypothetical protein